MNLTELCYMLLVEAVEPVEPLFLLRFFKSMERTHKMGYYNDEYEDYEGYDDYEPELAYLALYLGKAANGHLYISEITAWIECNHEWYWEERKMTLKEAEGYGIDSIGLVEVGKVLKAGEEVEL